ncbi:MAG: HAMP domain-containing histidine kinase [Planctomycetaceae bacterium]|nr:HAMP domain-containing histidine kinase [Planctomycetaceae bacterium]
MQWPIRNQIFVPFAILLILSVSLVAVVAVWTSAEQSGEQKLDHMQAVADALGEAQFPLTVDIAERISAMVDGEVIVSDPAGQITATTLPLTSLPDRLRGLAGSLEKATAEVRLMDKNWIVTVIPRRRVPRPGPLFVLMPQQDLTALSRAAIMPVIWVAVPTLLLALLLALLIAGGLAGRVERLRQLFGRLSLGEYQRVDVSGRDDELRDLLCSANDLSRQLNVLQQQVRKSDRLQLLGQLSGGLAHQLRNSIAGARMAVQLHTQSRPQDDSDMLKTALAQLRLTEEQVEAVLSLREGGGRSAEPVVIGLSEMLEGVRDLLRPQSVHWNTGIQMVLPETAVYARLISPSSLRGALLNIVLNAMEAAGVDGCVRLRLTVVGDDVQIDVTDNGPGFSFATDDLTDVFRTTKPEGIGLGLTIARHAVSQEHGTFQIVRDEGWTTVRIRLVNVVVAAAEMKA